MTQITPSTLKLTKLKQLPKVTAASRFRLSFCWRCQTDQPRVDGETVCLNKTGPIGGPQRFICAQCVAERTVSKASNPQQDAA